MFIQNVCWRITQFSLCVFGIFLYFLVGGQELFGTGFPTVFGAWGTGLVTALVGTKLIALALDRISSKRSGKSFSI